MSTTAERSIAGIAIPLAMPYAAGHAITEAEAKALNQVRAENILNNCRKAVKELGDADGNYSAEAQKAVIEMVQAKDAEYEFTLSNATGRSVDPLQRLITTVAREVVNANIQNAGITIKHYRETKGEDAYQELIAKASEHEAVIKNAKARLKQREALADIEI